MLLAGTEFASWRRKRRRRKDAVVEDDDDFPLEVDDRGEVVDVILDRPHVHNAFSRAMRVSV